MKNALISLFLLFITVQYVAAQKKVIKIACIGNSITYGVGTRNPAKDSYPAVLGRCWATVMRSGTLESVPAPC